MVSRLAMCRLGQGVAADAKGNSHAGSAGKREARRPFGLVLLLPNNVVDVFVAVVGVIAVVVVVVVSQLVCVATAMPLCGRCGGGATDTQLLLWLGAGGIRREALCAGTNFLSVSDVAVAAAAVAPCMQVPAGDEVERPASAHAAGSATFRAGGSPSLCLRRCFLLHNIVVSGGSVDGGIVGVVQFFVVGARQAKHHAQPQLLGEDRLQAQLARNAHGRRAIRQSCHAAQAAPLPSPFYSSFMVVLVMMLLPPSEL